MATSLSSQLQAIKSVHKGTPDPIRRPLTRPSVLFGPKEAADIDLRSILSIALSGLEVLVELDTRYEKYKGTLFTQTSLDLDRGKMVQAETEKLDRSISSYLRLVSGNLELPAALKTLEYLIRRYEVHLYNVDELVLCALPYHDTHAFVRIVQLLNLEDKKWAFLQGVKASGAPPPRKVIVQQCIRDKGLLEMLCDYAKPTSKFQHARPVICFCTAVVVESLGSMSHLETDTVKRVLPFVFDGLNPDMKGSHDHKAGALMVVGLLSTKATLAPNLVQNLAFFIARAAQRDTEQSADLPWIRVMIMGIVSLVQSQSAQVFPKKAMMALKKIRDLPGILSGLSQEFNIQKFLSQYLEALVDHSTSDTSCLDALISMLEALQIRELIEKLVYKLLAYCLRQSCNKDASSLRGTGERAKKILVAIDKNYPSELCSAVQKFLENSKLSLNGDESNLKTFCLMFDEGLEMATDISDSKIWFSLEHPKADVRRAALTGMTSSGILEEFAANPQTFLNFQNAIIRRLHDDDLGVVKAAFSVRLVGIVDPSLLLRAYGEVLSRCVGTIVGSTSATPEAFDVAMQCMEHMVLDVPLDNLDFSKEVATFIFPLLLVFPKTWRLNLKALEIAKQIQWPFYGDSIISCDLPTSSELATNLGSSYITATNLKTIKAFAETFRRNPERHIQWLVDCSRSSSQAKSLFLLITFHAAIVHNEDSCSLLKLYEACYTALRDDWLEIESSGQVPLTEEVNMENIDMTCIGLVDQLLTMDSEMLNIKTHICVYWSILNAYTEQMKGNSLVDHPEQQLVLHQLFLFFSRSPSKRIFRKHLHFLVRNCTSAPYQFLHKYYTEEGFPVEVQIESLNSLATLCSLYGSSESSLNENSYLELLLGFSSFLIPLSNSNKDIRIAAANCIVAIGKLWRQLDKSRLKNGNDTLLSHCLLTPTVGELLELIVSHRELISSDAMFLPSFLTSMFATSSGNLFVPENISKRFNQASKDAILLFVLSSALKFSSYGKLVVLSLLKDLGNSILQVEGVEKLLLDLSEVHKNYCLKLPISGPELSKSDIEVLCLLLEVCLHPSNPPCSIKPSILDCLINALKVDRLSSNEQALLQPCIAVLQHLTSSFYDLLEAEMQDNLFFSLVFLVRNANADIRNAARGAILQINFSSLSVVSLFGKILGQNHQTSSSNRIKGETIASCSRMNLFEDQYNGKETKLYLLGSLLDILLLKKDIEKRESLIAPLLNVLEKLFTEEWLPELVNQDDKEIETFSDIAESISSKICHAQQTVLLILEDISHSLLLNKPQQEDLKRKFKIDILVECARFTDDMSTRNHVFSLLSSVAKASPRCLSGCMSDIFSLIGESAAKQTDGHSQWIMEDLISTLVPCWLAETGSTRELLQIFVKTLPDVPEHRRLTLIVYLLRSLGEKDSLGLLIYHLFSSFVSRSNKPSQGHGNMQYIPPSADFVSEWEYIFALQLCSRYSSEVWFPCLVKLLDEIKMHIEHKGHISVLHVAIQFILQKLEDPELFFQVESGKHPDYLQVTLGKLLEQVVLHLQFVNARSKLYSLSNYSMKEFKDCSNSILKTVTMWMLPSIYFKTITQLLEHSDANIKKKALLLVCETIKDQGLVQKKCYDKRSMKQKLIACQLDVDEKTTSSFNELCLKIVELINCDSETSVKLAAISSLEVLSNEFPSDNLIFSTCLACVVEYIGSANLAISCACLHSTGALVKALGSKSLSHLPQIMKLLFERAHEIFRCPAENSKYSHINTSSSFLDQKMLLLLSIFVVLEAVIENLGGFLNPYLEDILNLILLHPEYISESDPKMKLKMTSVRKLLTERLPVRLMLAPLMNMYSPALSCSESSLCLVFEMLACIVSAMDRSSIVTYHVKIFEQCLMALDVRHQHPDSIQNVNVVEESVFNAMIVLTMKLTETMFRPLFIRSLEWADSRVEGSDNINLDRAITFYKLINKIVEKHRSLFVPYFKHLLDGCTRHLTEDLDTGYVPSMQKKKKAKHGDGQSLAKAKDTISPKQWHLRTLILKSLHQSFLYDTMELKFLDASNFQVLLKPIVSQMVVEPPTSRDALLDIPTMEEVDETLVLCLGQMAITAHSDVLWKPLNHEVLMQTRNEKVRPKILGLKVVKYLVEHLKEEYLVFLPETIPFLGELLEDVELPVKTLAQEILKDMETLSGENLQQYL